MRIKGIDGKPVIDAKRPIKLHITPKDISGGDPKHPESCAAARALLREQHCKEVRIHLGRVYVRSNESNWQRYITPKNLRSEIIAFDRGGAFEPGEFVLAAPQPAKKLGKRRGGSSPFRRSSKKRRAPTVVNNVRTGPA